MDYIKKMDWNGLPKNQSKYVRELLWDFPAEESYVLEIF